MKQLLPVLLGVGLLSTAAAQTDPLAQQIALLEERVSRAESVRAIKRLQYAYGHYVESGLWHDFADLFTEDAVAHYPAGDLGREAIRELFFEQVGGGQLGLAEGRLYPHFVLQPVVTLAPDGQTAHGRWHVLTLLGGLGGNATWVGNLYENDYVLEDGVWKISELRTYTQFSGSYANGWTSPSGAPPSQDDMCENYLINSCTIAFHFEPEQAGDPLQMGAFEPAIDSAVPPGELAARTANLERRVNRLVDESAVRNLQHTYAYRFERQQWDSLITLFTDDATYELGLQGVYQGRNSIRRMFGQFDPPSDSAQLLDERMQLQTVVTVAPDGLTARARVVELGLHAVIEDGQQSSVWHQAIYENRFVKVDGEWKISAVHRYPRFATDYALGWGRDAQPAPVASEAYPPDAPPTVEHGVYPEFHIPPYHFVNPVTGAPPQYPEGPEYADAAYTEAGLARVEATVVDAAASGAELAVLAESLATIGQQLEVAIGGDAVENIANAYAYYLDELDRDAVARLFIDEPEIRVANATRTDLPEIADRAIELAYRSDVDGRPEGFVAIHQALQPLIFVTSDGESAAIQLRLFEPVGRVNEEGAWIAATFDAAAIREDDTWRLVNNDVILQWAVSYSEGWAGAAE